MKKAIIVILATAALLSGCVSQDYIDTKKAAEEVHNTIDAATKTVRHNKVERVRKPPVRIKALKQTPDPAWLNEGISVNVADLPLSMVIAQIMNGIDSSVWFDGDVDPNKPVTLSYSGPRRDVLNLLARQTDYGITPMPGKIEVRKFISETFVIPLASGKYKGQLGSQGTQSGEGDNTRIEGQYMNVSYDDVDVFTEVSNGIKSLLKSPDGNEEQGQVSVLPSLSMVSVRTSPARMAQVRRFVDTYTKALDQQVLLEMQVLSFSSNLGKERGIDWNIIKDVGEGTLQFFIPGTNTVSKGAGYGLAFQGTGKWTGTSAFIKALEQQGTVAISTPVTALVLNNQPSQLSQIRTTPFLSEIKTEANDNVVSTSVTRDTVKEGVDMMVTPIVLEDHVSLRIAGKLTKIVSDTNEIVNEINLRFIETEESPFILTNKLRYGQTYVIASVKQQTSRADKAKNFGLDALGGQSSINNTVETLVLLTPRRAL